MAYKKVNKKVAREYYNNGVTVLIVGDNVNEYHLENGWHLAYPANKEHVDANNGIEYTFDDLVRNFEFYLERELGKRAAYYLKV